MPANVILLDAVSEYDAVRRQSPVLASIRRGRVIANTLPAQTFVALDGPAQEVDFTHSALY